MIFSRGIFARSYLLLGSSMFVLQVLRWPSKKRLHCDDLIGAISLLMRLIESKMRIPFSQKQ